MRASADHTLNATTALLASTAPVEKEQCPATSNICCRSLRERERGVRAQNRVLVAADLDVPPLDVSEREEVLVLVETGPLIDAARIRRDG